MSARQNKTLANACKWSLVAILAIALPMSSRVFAQLGVPVRWPAALALEAQSDDVDDSGICLATDGAGLWLAVWSHLDDRENDYDIRMSFSLDNGLNWSDPVPLNSDSSGDYRDDEAPCIATDRNGTWIAVWEAWDYPVFLHDNFSSSGVDRDILVARSVDGGTTWTAPALLNSNGENDIGQDDEPQIATDGRGTWVVVWSSNEPNLGGGIGTDYDIVFCRSTDNGQT
jgi:Neuraminidase (sialidase)